jgi:hypothetical protein
MENPALRTPPKMPVLYNRPLFLIIIGWLFPGCGFFFLGPRNRLLGILYFAAVHLTFIIGVCLHGGLLWPVWTFRDPAFSIVNNLTFVVQLGSGWLGIASLIAHFVPWSFAAGETQPLFELGSFYCLVAGGINYFIVCQSLDRSEKKAFEVMAKL